VFQHFGTNFAPEYIKNIAFPIETGTIAVAVFFLVSGFVIIEASEVFYSGKPLRFIANRSIRIFPMFIIALAAAIVVEVALRHAYPQFASAQDVSQPGKFGAREIVLNVTMVLDSLNLFKDYATHSFIMSAWTLRQEYFFYIAVFAVMAISLISRRDKSKYRRNLAIASFVFIGVFCADYYEGLANLSLECAPFFIFGGAWYCLISKKSASRIVPIALLALSACAMLWQQHARIGVPTWYPRADHAQLVMLVVLVAVFCILSKTEIDKSSRWRTIDSRMGDLTFSLYLNHQVALTAFSIWFKPTLLTFLCGIIASVMFSLIMQMAFEPWIARLRNFVRGRRIDASEDARGDAPLAPDLIKA
jgi:peptidoglycan/LPS O-acetylase OafA/YrhL